MTLIIGFAGGYLCSNLVNKDKLAFFDKFSDFAKVENFLDKKGKINESQHNAAIEEAVNSYYTKCTDKYFYYYKDSNVTNTINIVNNSPMAIDNGFKIDCTSDGSMIISSVENDSYAYKQGLRQGDIIVSIGKRIIADKGFGSTASYILGKNDTSDKITLIRNGKTVTLTYKRKFKDNEEIQKYKMMGKICYINYQSGFNMLTENDMLDAVKECDKSAESYIIDLRNNPGGEIGIALSSADVFCNAYKNVIKKHLYNGKTESFDLTDGGIDQSKKIVLLVNDKSASSSEIFTALMKQFFPNTTIVGTNTFGKGIFQYIYDFSDGSEVKYTAGYSTIGNWECYQGKGIAPDVEVNMDSSLIGTDKDTQLQKAIDLLENK